MGTRQEKKKTTAVDEFVKQVEAKLAESGMSISELSRRSLVARPYIHRILAGEQVPSFTIAEAIAKVLGLKITTLSVA